MNLEQLLAQLRAIDEQLDALLPNPDLTDEQRAQHDGLVAERGKVKGQIDRVRQKMVRDQERTQVEAEAAEANARQVEADRRRAEAEERQRRTVVNGAGRRTTPDQPADEEAASQSVRIVIPARVKQLGQLKNFRGRRHGMEADQRAFKFGCWALLRLSQDMPSRYGHFGRVEHVQKYGAAVTEKDSTGYQRLVPEEFGTDLIDLRERFGVVRRLFRNVPMMSDTRTDPRRQGGLTAYFVSEGAAGTESNKNWDNIQLTAKDLMVLSRYTNQLSADAVINIGDDLAGEIAYAFANKEDECGINGDGSSTYGRIQGLRTKLQDVDGAGTDSYGLITGTGNAYSELTLADFHKVVGRLPQYADTQDAVWLAHRTFYYEVMQRLELAAGGVTAMEISQGDRRPRPLFLGYPVEFSQVMPSAEANSQVCAVLGDLKAGAAFGDRQQDEIAFSEHATIGGENVFERNQIAIRGTERFDINVHDVGTSTVAGPIVGLQTAGS